MSITLLKNDFLMITQENKDFFIESFQKGMSIQDLSAFLASRTDFEINDFNVIKDSIINAPRPKSKFAVKREKFSIEVSKDKIKAYIYLNVDERDLYPDFRRQLIEDIEVELKNHNIIYGIKTFALINEKLENNVRYLVAEGTPPVHGHDCKITLIELKDPKPILLSKLRIDYYEVNVINSVKIGDRVGERIEATKGTLGKSIDGSVLNPIPGKNLPFKFDPASIEETTGDGVTQLTSKKNGAILIINDLLQIKNTFVIEKDVDFSSGSIQFDGNVVVKGTVIDSFSVIATQDIEIRSQYGIGAVKEIISKEGSVIITGGITGKKRSLIKAKKDIFLKFASDTTIICEGTVHIGYYCLNCDIQANEVIFDGYSGSLIGGNVVAENRILAVDIGSELEKSTKLTVKGFNRTSLEFRIETIHNDIDVLKLDLFKLDHEITLFKSLSLNERLDSKPLALIEISIQQIHAMISVLETEKTNILKMLKLKGFGEVKFRGKAYPGSEIIIRDKSIKLEKPYKNSIIFADAEQINIINQ